MAAALPAGMPNKRKRPTVNVVDGIPFRDIEVSWNNISVSGGFNKRRKEQLLLTTGSFLIPGDTKTTEFNHGSASRYQASSLWAVVTDTFTYSI